MTFQEQMEGPEKQVAHIKMQKHNCECCGNTYQSTNMCITKSKTLKSVQFDKTKFQSL